MTDTMLSQAKDKNRYIVTERILRSLPNKYCRLPVSIVDSFSAVQELLGNFFETKPFEVVYAVALDSSNRFLGFLKISEGSVNKTNVYLRTIFTFLLCDTNATGLILAHNHPSGDTTPSNADIKFTEKMYKAASLMDIILHDHLIIGNNHYSSLREMGYLNGT